VSLHPKRDLLLTTDESGGFSLEVAAGFHAAAVFAYAFSPTARKVRIGSGQRVVFHAKLPLDIHK
jgi:hypothetical protein